MCVRNTLGEKTQNAELDRWMGCSVGAIFHAVFYCISLAFGASLRYTPAWWMTALEQCTLACAEVLQINTKLPIFNAQGLSPSTLHARLFRWLKWKKIRGNKVRRREKSGGLVRVALEASRLTINLRLVQYLPWLGKEHFRWLLFVCSQSIIWLWLRERWLASGL